MGLSGRKTKQRIPNDPRNLAWANDANKFGAAYLAKFGWDPSGGLGVSGEGRTKALSVHQKLDMLGIGADHKNNAEGIAWKQNKDFESLLRRLNAANGGGEAEEVSMKIDGFTKGAPMTTVDAESNATPGVESKDEVGVVEEKRTKKKRKKGGDGEESERKKKQHKKSKSPEDESEDNRRKEMKQGNKDDAEADAVSPPLETETSTPSTLPASRSVGPFRHPRSAFRARHMAAKSRASASTSAMAEILGIADSGSVTPATPSSIPTPYPRTPFEAGPSTGSSEPSGAATPVDEIKLQELTVSSKSVMDYFKDKLAAKSQLSSLPSTPALEEADDYDERPRMGLGASRMRMEVTQAAEERRGLGGIGSGMRSSFASMFTSAAVACSTTVIAEQEAKVDEHVEESPEKIKDKKDKERKKEKKKRRREKEKLSEEAGNAEEMEKADRKRRKEERRRWREPEAQTSASAATIADRNNASDLQSKEKKTKSKQKK